MPSWDLAFTATFIEPTETTTTVASSKTRRCSVKFVTLTATVAGGPSTGNVEFFDGAHSLGTKSVNGAGLASLSTGSLDGANSITAVYAGIGIFRASTSTVLTQTVNKASTTTALVSATNPVDCWRDHRSRPQRYPPVSPGAGTRTGNVELYRGRRSRCDLGRRRFRRRHLLASLPDRNEQRRRHLCRRRQLHRQLLAHPLAGRQPRRRERRIDRYAQSVTYAKDTDLHGDRDLRGAGKARPPATSNSAKAPASSARFAVNGSGVATFSTSTLLGGSHTITAEYKGDAHHETATGTLSLVVNTGVSVDDRSLTHPALRILGQSVTFTATVTGVGITPTGKVTFREGPPSSLNRRSTAPASRRFRPPRSASACTRSSRPTTATTTTAPALLFAIDQQVDQASTTTVVDSSSYPSIVGENVRLTATVSTVGPGAGSPTGTVSFFDGATLLGSASIDGSHLATLAVGAHAITAVYAGDTSFTGSASTMFSQEVEKDGTPGRCDPGRDQVARAA